VFGYQHPHQAEAWFHHRGGMQMLRDAYAKYNVYPVGVSWWGVESIVSKKPIMTMEDFKGVKFRSPQGMTAEILTKLGPPSSCCRVAKFSPHSTRASWMPPTGRPYR
jgi:TRAP-type mannitol/chloroaromatic compound transport system substrate-binding protein